MNQITKIENEVSFLPDFSHAQGHMDAKNLTHPTGCLSAKLNFSRKIDELLFRFSVCSLKVF